MFPSQEISNVSNSMISLYQSLVRAHRDLQPASQSAAVDAYIPERRRAHRDVFGWDQAPGAVHAAPPPVSRRLLVQLHDVTLAERQLALGAALEVVLRHRLARVRLCKQQQQRCVQCQPPATGARVTSLTCLRL